MDSDSFIQPRGGEILAELAAAAFLRLKSGIEFISDQFREIKSPDDCRTPQELLRYAYSIQEQQPDLANELIAIANRSLDK